MMKETSAQEMDRLRAENAALKEKANGAFSIKVGDKGGMSVKGLQRFPITLYKEQWQTLLVERRDELLAFLKAYDKELKAKA